MDNNALSDNFSLLSKLMDIHGDNGFKAKSYSSAAFTIDRLTTPLADLPVEKIFAIRGIGDAIGKKIIEQIETGQLSILNEYLQKTPPGILEMLGIKGIGPKKISTIWKDLEVETVGELLYACNENRLTLYKGFGEKSQQNIKEAIEFYLGSLGSYLYQQMESYAIALDAKLKEHFTGETFALTGDFVRQMEIITQLEWVTTASAEKITAFFSANDYEISLDNLDTVVCKGKENVQLNFHLTNTKQFYSRLFQKNASETFLKAWNEQTNWDPNVSYPSEEAIFSTAGIPYIPIYLRETAEILTRASKYDVDKVIKPDDIRGIIHSHSNWSDGAQSLEIMATEARKSGFEYLVISDHSKSAFYANGLSEDRISAQHLMINELNERFSPFKIFKSIESDILNDGSLDYNEDVLASFDLVIASVHSNLKMSEEKAMARLLKAIENPFTSILGHMTGRLLLSRNGYPLDHKRIIDACAANGVTIELNAHPRRLDIDWRWIDYALAKGVLLSINPDAHATEGYADCRYGVLVAQKAGLTKEHNLSSFGLEAFETYLAKQKSKRN